MYDNLGVLYNVGSAARKLEGDDLTNKGINPIIDHADFGAVVWGNRTLYRPVGAGSQLQKANVADLIIELNRELRPLIQSELFEPNDVATWRNVHRKVTTYMETVRTNRGVSEYLYQGDQNVDTVADATINSADDIANGVYKFILYIKPISAIEYVQVQVTITATDVDLTVLTN